MTTRRHFLEQAGLLAIWMSGGAMVPGSALAAEHLDFAAINFDEALASLGSTPVDSQEVTLISPEIAEDGAAVPVAVISRLPKSEAIYILVEKNPFPLTASFTICEDTEAFVSTRVKMSESTKVWAVVKADGKLYSVSRETKVTLGGCGG